jgi:lipoprotein NlpD
MDIQKNFVLLFIFFLFFSLVGCATPRHSRHIPVRDVWHQPWKGTTSYVVQSGDTLYSIAWAYGLDYRQVALANKIVSPAYHIEVGEKIILTAVPASTKTITATQRHPASAAVPPASTSKLAQRTSAAQQPVTTPTPPPATTTQQSVVTSTPARVQFIAVRTVQRDGVAWAWPAQGRLICTFSTQDLNKGIDIAAKNGAPVVAAASGKVVYASNGLRGYGLLIIIKHNDEYLSAYAHNQKLLVAEGQNVRAGQVIAKMGSTEARRVMLHFEIRKAGKPVNPLQYLPKR